MKPTYKLAMFLALAASTFCLTSCITTETTITNPDGTVTTTKTTAPAPGYDSAAVILAHGIVVALDAVYRTSTQTPSSYGVWLFSVPTP